MSNAHPFTSRNSVIMRVVTITVLIAVTCFAAQNRSSSHTEADGRAWFSKVSLAAVPCESQTQHRQFDFWIGEWNVTTQNTRVAESSIQKIIGGCVIYENYSQADGFAGKSFNFYDSTLKKWRQTWVDSAGNVSEFVGEFKEGSLHYEGESHRQNGSRVLRKMIFYNLGPDRVRQFSQRSTDGGKTWSVAYDFMYERKK